MGRVLLRVLLLRAHAVVLLAAFAVAWFQWAPLLGDDGLTPVNAFLDRVHQPRRSELTRLGDRYSLACLAADFIESGADAVGVPRATVQPMVAAVHQLSLHHGRHHRHHCLPLEAFRKVPTALWFVPVGYVDAAARAAAGIGAVTALLIFITGACTAPVMLGLWAVYVSLVSVGQDWYGFGWESQLCETTFLIAFACPWFRWHPYPDGTGIPLVTTWLLRWLILRIMVGAGLIKLRGDQCWRDFTCMNYHYHTQPVPNPLVGMLHAMPKEWHVFEVFVNHFVECAAPFYLLLPQPCASIGALLQIGFQASLIISGNLSFLNWLTMIPAIAGLDDRFIGWMFTASSKRAASRAADDADSAERSAARRLVGWVGFAVRHIVQVALLCLVGYLSVPVVDNLLSQRQAMNTSFDWLRLVNTYGAFGSVTKDRREVVVEGRAAHRDGGGWHVFEFNCKPTDIDRRPCIISPYHYRLDWLMWFAAFSDGRRTAWLLQLSHTMLRAGKEPHAHETVSSLVAGMPFRHPNATIASLHNDTRPAGPTELRLTLWDYEVATAGRGGGPNMRGRGVERGLWWIRRKAKNAEYLPVLRPGQLDNVAEHYRVTPRSW